MMRTSDYETGFWAGSATKTAVIRAALADLASELGVKAPTADESLTGWLSKTSRTLKQRFDHLFHLLHTGHVEPAPEPPTLGMDLSPGESKTFVLRQGPEPDCEQSKIWTTGWKDFKRLGNIAWTLKHFSLAGVYVQPTPEILKAGRDAVLKLTLSVAPEKPQEGERPAAPEPPITEVITPPRASEPAEPAGGEAGSEPVSWSDKLGTVPEEVYHLQRGVAFEEAVRSRRLREEAGIDALCASAARAGRKQEIRQRLRTMLDGAAPGWLDPMLNPSIQQFEDAFLLLPYESIGRFFAAISHTHGLLTLDRLAGWLAGEEG